MQQAFLECDAYQCGYCTPGQIMSAIGCVNEGQAETEDDIREYMSGNLCRCAAYPKIVKAVLQAKAQMHGARWRLMRPFTLERAADAGRGASARRGACTAARAISRAAPTCST